MKFADISRTLSYARIVGESHPYIALARAGCARDPGMQCLPFPRIPRRVQPAQITGAIGSGTVSPRIGPGLPVIVRQLSHEADSRGTSALTVHS